MMDLLLLVIHWPEESDDGEPLGRIHRRPKGDRT